MGCGPSVQSPTPLSRDAALASVTSFGASASRAELMHGGVIRLTATPSHLPCCVFSTKELLDEGWLQGRMTQVEYVAMMKRCAEVCVILCTGEIQVNRGDPIPLRSHTERVRQAMNDFTTRENVELSRRGMRINIDVGWLRLKWIMHRESFEQESFMYIVIKEQPESTATNGTAIDTANQNQSVQGTGAGAGTGTYAQVEGQPSTNASAAAAGASQPGEAHAV